MGEELRQTKRELQKVEKINKEKEKEVEDVIKRQEIVARTAEREREKAEKDRNQKHKRQVEDLGKDLEQDMEEKDRDTRQLIRGLRQELKLQEDELKVARQEGVALTEQVLKEQKQTERHKRAGETWQARHKELFENQVGNGERVIELEGEVKCKTRELATLGKKLETTCSAQVEEIKKRDLQAQVSPGFLCVLCLMFVVSNFLLYFS